MKLSMPLHGLCCRYQVRDTDTKCYYFECQTLYGRHFHSLISFFLLFQFTTLCTVIKVAWIQSNYGTRMMGLHITIVVLALGGSFSELLSRLLSLGSNNALSWMASSFNLNDWDVVTNSTDGDLNDMIGWRTLQMIGIATSGLLLWIDAVEYLFLSGILILFAFSIQTDNQLFGKRWAKFGLIMAALGIIEFAVAILRFENWGVFSTAGALINILNQLILFPVWLVWLGRQLPKAEEARNAAKNTNNVETESADSMLT